MWTLLARAARRGAGYGTAVACVELGFAASMWISLRLPAMTANTVTAAAVEITLGTVLGVVAAPLLRAPGGGALHAVAMAAACLGLQRHLAMDPADPTGWLVAPVAGLLLLAAGGWIGRRRPLLPWAIGALALCAVVVVPAVVAARRSAHDAATVTATAPPPGAPDVVLVVIDSVRAANVSASGYARNTTPHFDALARESALFLDATSPSTWSLPSHGSLFTGWFPSAHGVHGEHRLLGPQPPTLADVMAAAGWDTRCFTANPHISDTFGLTRGFRWSDESWRSGAGGGFFFAYRLLDRLGLGRDDKGGGVVARNFAEWMASRPGDDRPTFTFINFLEAHFPYHQLPAPFLFAFADAPLATLRDVSLKAFGAQFGRTIAAEDAETVTRLSIDMYDGGVRYTDDLLGRVVEALRRSGRLDDTILVVLADHGEMIGEHGAYGHGAGLYEPGTRVPLLVRYPPRVRAAAQVREPVSTVGVFATIVDLAGITAPGRTHVGSLLPALDGRPAGAPVIVERYVSRPDDRPAPPLLHRDRRYRVYRTGTDKLVRTSAGDTFLFDLAADPGETTDRAATDPETVARLGAELDDWTASLGLPPLDAPIDFEVAPAIDPAAQERLRALGYVE
jgi:arylsulfatase A-like enzyme